MDREPRSESRLTSHDLPERGIRHVLSAWAGEGELARAIAQVEGEVTFDRNWSDLDVRRRAHRILFERLRPALLRWPRRMGEWLDVLPVTTSAIRHRAPHPFPGVSWSETVRRGGLSPLECFGRVSRRGQDSLLLSTLRWTVDALLSVASDAKKTSPESTKTTELQLKAVGQLLESGLLSDVSGEPPDQPALTVIRREGAPWGALAEVATHLRVLQGDASTLAMELLAPDPDIRWRLFHIGVLGEFLIAMAGLGCRLTSLRPLSGGFTGPSFLAEDKSGTKWDIWFEAGAIWGYPPYALREPYREATLGTKAAYRPLGADIMITSPGRAALVIECKFGDAEYVCRNGYLQALAYAVEARQQCPRVISMVVGPTGVVGLGTAQTAVGTIFVGNPDDAITAVTTLLQ
jgi:hypothetical protein